MRTKHVLTLALISQAIILMVNSVIVFTAIKNLYFNSQIYAYLPTAVATILMCVYYSRYIKKVKKQRTFIAIACVIANMINLLMVYSHLDLYLYTTSVTLLINASFIMKYTLPGAKKVVSGNSILSIQGILLFSMALSIISLFIGYVDQLLSMSMLMVSSLVFITSIVTLLRHYLSGRRS